MAFIFCKVALIEGLLSQSVTTIKPNGIMTQSYLNCVNMDYDLLAFLAGVSLLILYLIFSALTEMGTKLPWKK